uniref:Uncharacterized protein n=1 Tax=Clastoptera arizonana TaxID=38151 RepID=A0A1B6D350_9HEMI
MDYITFLNPDISVTEVINNSSQHEDNIYIPLSPTQEELSLLIDATSPRHNQLAAVLKLSKSDLPQIRVSPNSRLRSLKYYNFHLNDEESDSKTEQNFLEEPRINFFRTATHLNGTLEDLTVQTCDMLCEMILLKQDLEELESHTDILLLETKQLREELQDLCYLDDLIHLMNGQLDRITIKQWPFSIAHDNKSELNLII